MLDIMIVMEKDIIPLTRGEIVEKLRDGGITEEVLIASLKRGLEAERTIQGMLEVDYKERRETVKLCLQLYGYLDSGINVDMRGSQFSFLDKLPRDMVMAATEAIDVPTESHSIPAPSTESSPTTKSTPSTDENKYEWAREGSDVARTTGILLQEDKSSHSVKSSQAVNSSHEVKSSHEDNSLQAVDGE